MRPLSFHYSLNYDDFMRAVVAEFDEWVQHELDHGGVSAVRIDFKIAEFVRHYVPTGARQLLELALQCEALLDVEIEDPIFGYQPEDAYEALRIAISRSVADEIEAHWQGKQQALDHTHQVIPLPTDGVGTNGGGKQRLDEDELADAA
jgi:hypothetical protein